MAVNNNLVKKDNQRLSFSAFMMRDAAKDQVNKILGGKDGQRFVSAIVSAVNATPALQDCTNMSIFSAALLGEGLKLSPSPQLGHYYMVPFKDKDKGMVAQFVLGYKGYIQLAIRSGEYRKLTVVAIKEGELIEYNPLDETIDLELIKDENQREKAKTIGYYAMFELINGYRKAIYWSREKMEAHAEKYSPGYRAKKGFTFWEKDFDSMAYKTMLRQLISKWGIMSIEMQSAMDADMATINEDGTKNYVEFDDGNVIEAPAAEVKEEPAKTTKKAKTETQEAPAEDPAAALFG